MGDTAMAVLATAMAVLATDMAVMARGLLTLRLTLTTAMVAFTPDTVTAVWAMVMVDTATSDKSAKGWCRELQPMKRCSISKLEIGNKSCSLKIRYFLMCIFMDKKQNVIKNEK